MPNAICQKAIDLGGLHSTYGTCGSHVHSPRPVQPGEPIHVRVRVRQYAEAVPEVRQARSDGPDLGRLPVGSVLDCYM